MKGMAKSMESLGGYLVLVFFAAQFVKYFDWTNLGLILPRLLEQFGLAESLCRALGIVTWPMVEFEADDALATAAARFGGGPVSQVVICSPDKDLMQCVRGQSVVCWDRMRDRIYGEAEVIEKFGVAPGSIPDLLALVGDSADGIPGVPRWGMKSAATVLAHYQHLEAIPHDEADWVVRPRGAKALCEQLQLHAREARLYKQLTTLRLDVPLAESLEDLRYRGAVKDELDAVCEQLADSSLRESVQFQDSVG
jgi:5'-3' exonuclease